MDAVINVENHNAGLGIVIRDADSSFVAARAKTIKCFSDVASPEAIYWGMSIAVDAGL